MPSAKLCALPTNCLACHWPSQHLNNMCARDSQPMLFMASSSCEKPDVMFSSTTLSAASPLQDCSEYSMNTWRCVGGVGDILASSSRQRACTVW